MGATLSIGRLSGQKGPAPWATGVRHYSPTGLTSAQTSLLGRFAGRMDPAHSILWHLRQEIDGPSKRFLRHDSPRNNLVGQQPAASLLVPLDSEARRYAAMASA